MCARASLQTYTIMNQLWDFNMVPAYAGRGNPHQLRIIDFFDVVGGTSTGGLIAACLTTREQSSSADVGQIRPASELVSMYKRLSKEVFPVATYKMRTCRGRPGGVISGQASISAFLHHLTNTLASTPFVVVLIESATPYASCVNSCASSSDEMCLVDLHVIMYVSQLSLQQFLVACCTFFSEQVVDAFAASALNCVQDKAEMFQR